MRKLLVLLTAIILSASAIAQTGLYIGYENGGLFDRYHYVNSKGFSLSQSSIGGVFGGYVGYIVNGYTLETGFYGFYSTHPFIVYNYDSGIPEKSGSMGSGAESWVIPIRFGKEFVFCNDRFFIKPDISFNTMISRDYSENQPTMGWGSNVPAFPGDPNFIAISADSTRAYGYVSSKLSFAIETGLSAGYRFKKKADIYLKGSYLANFNPMYYETIMHYSENDIVTSTSTAVNSFLVQIGVKYYFAKNDK